MLNRKSFKIIKPRELLAVEFTEQSKGFKLVYTEGKSSAEILSPLLSSLLVFVMLLMSMAPPTSPSPSRMSAASHGNRKYRDYFL